MKKKLLLCLVLLVGWNTAGALNLAPYAIPTADSTLGDPQFSIANLIDGSLDTYWASSSVTGANWYRLTWASTVSIDQVKIDFVYPTVPSGTWDRTWKDFNIKALNPDATDPSNPDNWTTIVAVTNNGNAPYVYTLPSPIQTKALQIDIFSTYGFPYVMAYELSAEGVSVNNIAPQAAVTVDSAYNSDYDGSKLVDNSTSTGWNSGDATVEHWAVFTWPRTVTINSITVDPYRDAYPLRSLQEFRLEKWTGTAWEQIDYCADLGTSYWPAVTGIYTFTPSSPITTNKIRLYVIHPTEYTQTMGGTDYWMKWARVDEVVVQGTVPPPVNLAPYAIPTADSTLGDPQFSIANLIDGSLDTYWASSSVTGANWYRLMWGDDVSVNQVKIDFVYPTVPSGTWDRTWKDFTIKTLKPGAIDPSNPSNWEVLVTVTDNGATPYIYTLPAPVQTRGLQIDILSTYGFPYVMAYELSVLGNLTTSPYDTLSTLGSNRGTSYPLSNKIISMTTGNMRKTHVIWLDNQNQDPNNGPTQVMYRNYDNSTNTWSTAVQLGTGADNHGGGAIASDSQGRLHVVYGPHNGLFKYRYTPTPGNYTSWSTEIAFGQGYGTYPSLVIDASDTLHLACRDNIGSGANKLVYYRKPSGGSWSTGTVLVDSQTTAYTEYTNALAIDGLGRLHLAYIIETEEAGPTYTSAFMYYMRSDDGGTTWQKTDGTVLSLPVTAATGEVVMEDTYTVYPNSPSLLVQNIVTDANNRPWIVCAIGSPRTTYLWNYDGTYWNVVELLPVMQQFYPYPGGYSNFDTVASMTTGGELYLFTSFNPSGVATWGTHPSQTAVLHAPVADVAAAAANNQSPTFALEIISPPDATRPNWNCSIERNVGHNPVNESPSLLYQVGAWDAVNTEIRYVDGGTHATSAQLTIEGTVTLQDYPASPVGISVDITILSSPVETHTVTLNAAGHYSFTTSLSGTYDVTAKASHWLKKKLTGVVLGTNPVNFSLVNGDANNDNAINSADVTVLLGSMDSISGGLGWTAFSDLDNDLAITSTDLAIVLSNMDRTGD